MSEDGKVNGEVVLNLADWIERRRDAVGPYADYIIRSVQEHEAEIARLRAEVERLTAERDTAKKYMAAYAECDRIGTEEYRNLADQHDGLRAEVERLRAAVRFWRSLARRQG